MAQSIDKVASKTSLDNIDLQEILNSIAIPTKNSTTVTTAPKDLVSLDEAILLYKLKNSRNPPLNYEKWYIRARDKKCTIHEYEQIWEDLAPFHQLGQEDYNRRLQLLEKDHYQIQKIQLLDGAFKRDMSDIPNFHGDLVTLVDKVAHLLNI